MNRVKEALFSKKGDAYIFLCVLIIFISMLLSVVILYMGMTAQIRAQKRDVQSKLDSYVTAYATEVYDALIQGAHREKYIDWVALEAGAYAVLGFDSESTEQFSYANGNCTMRRPTVTVLRGDGFGVAVDYVAVFPVRWNGETVTELEIPVTVTSYYKMK